MTHSGVRKIHKDLYDATINTKSIPGTKYLFGFAVKLSNRASKYQAKTTGDLASMLVSLFLTQRANDKAKKIINHEVGRTAEDRKLEAFNEFVDASRKNGQWFYLASSHNDCAKDHKAWQGKLYVDAKAPEGIMRYASARGLYTLQWVTDSPVYFITRPNCRHYFVSLKDNDVRGIGLTKLKRKYKTHRPEGNRAFQTPAKIAVEEYEDRLKLLKSLYREHPTMELKALIEKTQFLIDKWKHKI